ncbi:MAG: pitrilysin family protein [Pseudomonadota bacterium]
MLLVWVPAAQAITPEIVELEKKPLPKFEEPAITSGELPNGLRYYFLEDHEIPLVQLGVITKVGSIYEPSDKTGLATLAGMTMRTGGTKNQTPEELDIILEDLAAKISTSIDREMGNASLKVVAKDFNQALPIFFDILFKPSFDENRLQLGKLRIIEALRREDDYPEQIASREFKQLVYGKTNPWARQPTPESVQTITQADVQKFHADYFRPGNMIVYAAGDFNQQKLLATIKKLTTDLANDPVNFPSVPNVELKFSKQTKQIKRKLTQAYIETGHLGIKRDNPDKYALNIMNIILGGAPFKSRLMADIRVKRGMAYSIFSDFNASTDYGLFSVEVDTKAKNTQLVLALIQKHLETMAKGEDITTEEIDFAKRMVLNQLIFSFDNSYKIVLHQARYHFYGYPENYWHIYRQETEKVTLEDVKRAAGKYLHPQGLSTVIVGP